MDTQKETQSLKELSIADFDIDKRIPHACGLIDGIISQAEKLYDENEDLDDDLLDMLKAPRYNFNDVVPDIEKVRKTIENMREMAHDLHYLVAKLEEHAVDPNAIDYIEEFLEKWQ